MSENEFDISNEAITPISDYVEIHRNVVNNQIETGCFIQIKYDECKTIVHTPAFHNWDIVVYYRLLATKSRRSGIRRRTVDRKSEERERYCRLAVMAGHREACRMFCLLHPERFDGHSPHKPFKLRGIRISFYGYYYPSRYNALLNDEQRAFCHSIYQFKQGDIHGIEFFKTCMNALQLKRDLTI